MFIIPGEIHIEDWVDEGKKVGGEHDNQTSHHRVHGHVPGPCKIWVKFLSLSLDFSPKVFPHAFGPFYPLQHLIEIITSHDSVCPSIGQSVSLFVKFSCLSVCQLFLKGQEVTIPCSYQSTCYSMSHNGQIWHGPGCNLKNVWPYLKHVWPYITLVP